MTKFFISICCAFILLVSCNQTTETTTFYLVRHAEKSESNTMQDKNEDPPLTDEGVSRAKSLAELLGKKKIAAIYSTSYQRNMNTVKPLADAQEIAIENYEWHNWQPMVDDALSRFSGKTIVICGHGDNLLPMIEHLGGQKPQESLGSHEYDKIFKVEASKANTKVEVIIY